MKNITCSGGIFLSKKTKRFLFLHRALGKTANTWGFVGGKKEPNDVTLYETLLREIHEEVEYSSNIEKIIPLELYVSSDQHFQYNTYILLIKDEFIPKLNEEHSGYAWCSYNNFPKPLHLGVKTSFNSKIIKAKIELLLDLI